MRALCRLGLESCALSSRRYLAVGVDSSKEAVVATTVHLHQKEKVLEVGFSDGKAYKYSAELLRVCSPSAENTGENVKVPAGRRHVGIMGLELVGNYAVRILFDDLHNTGLFTWDYLHELGANKLSRAKQYIRTLRELGLSRDPRQSTARSRSRRRPRQG